MTHPREDILTIASRDDGLFAIAHYPAEGAPKRASAVVICHPYGDEKKAAHRPLCMAARRLARLGFGVLRFDLSGYGDSTGVFADATWQRWIEDAQSAAVRARTLFGVDHAGFLGLRMGANLAAQAGGNFAVLWEPVESGEAFVKQIVRKKMMKEMIGDGCASTSTAAVQAALDERGFIDADGYALSKALYNDLEAQSLLGSPPKASMVFILSIRHSDRIPPGIEAVTKAWKSQGAQCDVAALRCVPFWDRIDIFEPADVFELTETWLQRADRELTGAAAEARP